MAKKFFNQKINNTKKTVTQIIIIVVCVIGVIICFLIASFFNNRASDDAVIEIRESVAIEVNTDLPDKTLLFTKLENVKENSIKVSYKDVDTSKVGEYTATVELYRKKYEVKILVVDTISPELTLKDITINQGDSYKASDFVENCNDNSNDCNAEFYTLATDQDGNAIDYSNYTNAGTYKIQIIATDASNNMTIKDATLTIGTGGSNKPVACKYGDSNYDKDKYVLATNVTNNGCAIDLNLYQDKNIIAPVESIMEQETDKLKKEFSKLNVEGSISLNRDAVAVMNTAGKGIVGYTIHMELSITKDNKTEVVESYYLDANNKRVYSTNKYNLS